MRRLKDYWNAKGQNYEKNWLGTWAKEKLSLKELGFLGYFFKKYSPKRILDIGIGTGRILENYLAISPKDSQIFGLDISEKMVKICQNKFKNNKMIKKIFVFDIKRQDSNTLGKLDFISAVRVLQYNRSWKKIVQKISSILNRNGVFIFTMPYKYSISRLVKPEIPVYRTTGWEIKKVLKSNGLELLDMRTLSRLPDFFYRVSKSKKYAELLMLAEELLSLILGKIFLGRIYFVAALKRKD